MNSSSQHSRTTNSSPSDGGAKEITLRVLSTLMSPIIRYCIKHSIGIQEVNEVVKKLFVQAAERELKDSGAKTNKSRISVMTGIHRRDVDRLLGEESDYESKPQTSSLLTRVIGTWQLDQNFLTSSGKPRVLSFGSERSEFYSLVKSVSKDVSPGSVFSELERISAVERTPRGVKLVAPGYKPTEDVERGMELLGEDVNDLMESVQENLFDRREVPNLHATTEFNAVSPEDFEEVKSWLLKEGSEFHRKVRTFLSKFDQDISPSGKKNKNGRVVFSTFSRVEEEQSEK